MVKIIGHRASMHEGIYQNTLGGVDAALEHVDGLETDASLSADGDIFLVHDLMYLMDKIHYEIKLHVPPKFHDMMGERRLQEMTSDEIRSLRVQDGQSIPTMEQLLERCKAHFDFHLNIELKSEGTAEPVVTLLKQAVAGGLVRAEQIQLSTFNFPELAKARELAPEFKCGALFEPSAGKTVKMFPWNEDDTAAFVPLSKEALSDPVVRQIDPDYINIEERDLTQETVDMIAAIYPNAKINVWYYYDEPQPQAGSPIFQKIEQFGDTIYSVITNYPKAFAAAAKELGLR